MVFGCFGRVLVFIVQGGLSSYYILRFVGDIKDGGWSLRLQGSGLDIEYLISFVVSILSFWVVVFGFLELARLSLLIIGVFVVELGFFVRLGGVFSYFFFRDQSWFGIFYGRRIKFYQFGVFGSYLESEVGKGCSLRFYFNF